MPYQNPGKMGWRIVNDKEKFEEIKKRFETIKDKDGRPMSEVCKEYWEKRRGRS